MATSKMLDTADALEPLIEPWRVRLVTLDIDAVREKPDASRWAIAEVIGHLADSACNNHQRFVRAQFCDELVFPKYEQNEWVSVANYIQCDWESLVQFWYHYNRLIATLIRSIPDAALGTPCTITPYEPCTLEFLVIDYLDHLRHHLTILSDRLDSNGW